MKHLNIRIYGLVQGVGYRFFAQRIADQLGIKGFVRNEFDGSVYVECEGEEWQLREFIGKLKEGPWSADVKRVVVEEGEMQNYTDFRITF